ncbi:hypothetical protein [Aphanothece sacrum]|uniref:Cyclic nucleotide-binding protein n=1 Tax=Aphanothece sacrum FPU1 TaxID=1920663 RepID=A0A401IGK2_APHSA|nr:hypothetical protein [Aphanothece sacrum]GBF80320.1 cyclic nucleotide-binding protein [Aphanothece sacrum FPU1]GBF83727.1 cyclic nucleotide-binding domain protein [Aphanothece sacrum FPU3]
MSPLTFENKFPDCLFMKLHGELISNDNQQFNATNKSVELKLTIRFGEQLIEQNNQSIKFGLKKGCLELKFNDNSKILLETIGLNPKFESIIELEIQEEESKDREGTTSVALNFQYNHKTRETTKIVNKFKDQFVQVYNKGTEENPLWIFQIKPHGLILTGILQNEKLGIVQSNSDKLSITAIFKVNKEDILITEINGEVIENIKEQKKEILIQKFSLLLQQNPYLSKMELIYE